MESLFNPRSIAIIGASEVPGKAAERRIRSLLDGGYRGKIFLINPMRKKLFGRKVYPGLLAVEEEVDLVMIIVSPRFVLQAVADSVSKGARGIIIITAGLGETGEFGKGIEVRILEEASRTQVRIVGPNCSGLFSAASDTNLLGIPHVRKGGISVLAQSGNVIDSLTHYAWKRDLGFSKIISLGNAIGVRLHEYLEFLKEDPDTGVIVSYLEDIKEGKELVRVARETSLRKPVIVLKVGRFSAGARAAASHTGALAGDDLVVGAAFRQAGIIRVTNIDELFDLADVFSKCPLPKGNRVAILSEGGGDNSISADNAESYGIKVPVLSEPIQKKIRTQLLDGMPAANPIDYGGTAEENPDVISHCVEVCMNSEEVDAVYVTGFFGGFRDIIAPHVGELEEKTALDLAELVKTFRKPLFMQSCYAGEGIPALEILRKSGVPVIESADRSMRCLSLMMEFVENKQIINKRTFPEMPRVEPERIKSIFRLARMDRRTNLLETESRELLKVCGLVLPEARLARDQVEAVVAAKNFGGPVALKVVSPDILHKSDSGGIRLNLVTSESVENAFKEIMRNVSLVIQRDRVLGMLVTPMACSGQECIIGIVRDQKFGPVMMFGLGGIFVEVLKDVSFRVAPVSSEDIDSMIREIHGYPLLTGERGEQPKDIGYLKHILGTLSWLISEYPEIKEIDLNPVIIHEQGASIVDTRVILAPPHGSD